ncbi:pectinesterase family protein, partial [Acinetobacter baumannii]
GTGNFKTIQQAINSLPDSSVSPRILFIKKGVYNEKIWIEKHNIVLEGEDKNAVVLTYSIARDEWRCEHADDWGVATLNLRGND